MEGVGLLVAVLGRRAGYGNLSHSLIINLSTVLY